MELTAGVTTELSGAEITLRCLQEEGVEIMFGYPGGAVLPAIFSSDIGHWDVPDMRGVVPEAFELVERGHIDESQFRDFVFKSPAELWTSMNPAFFAGTSVEGAVGKLVGDPASVAGG